MTFFNWLFWVAITLNQKLDLLSSRRMNSADNWEKLSLKGNN